MNCSCNMPCEEPEMEDPRETMYRQHELIEKLQKQNREYEARFDLLLKLKARLARKISDQQIAIIEQDIQNELLSLEIELLKKECRK